LEQFEQFANNLKLLLILNHVLLPSLMCVLCLNYVHEKNIMHYAVTGIHCFVKKIISTVPYL